MKQFYPITFLLFLYLTLPSCDSPRTQRALSNPYTNSNNQANNGNFSGVNLNNNNSTNNPITTTNSGSTVTNVPNTTTSSTVVIPIDGAHCRFSSDGVSGFDLNSSHLGEYTLCQSSVDKNTFYLQIKTPPVNGSGDISVCFIPTNASANSNNSIYVGNAMCGYFKNSKNIYKFTFVKYSQYVNAEINGVLYFKDLNFFYASPYNSYVMTLEAYKTCMNALAYGDSRYCQVFKSVGQYLYKQF